MSAFITDGNTERDEIALRFALRFALARADASYGNVDDATVCRRAYALADAFLLERAKQRPKDHS